MAKTPEEMKEDSDILRSERFLRARDDDYMRYTATPASIAEKPCECMTVYPQFCPKHGIKPVAPIADHTDPPGFQDDMPYASQIGGLPGKPIRTKPAEQVDAARLQDYWRCFHCDFATTEPTEAQAHFGDIDDAEEFKPLCKWWVWMNAGERIDALQDVLKQLESERRDNERLRIANEGLEWKADSIEPEIKSYKPFRGCRSIYDLFCLYDSMEGRAIAAEEKETQPPKVTLLMWIDRWTTLETSNVPDLWSTCDTSRELAKYLAAKLASSSPLETPAINYVAIVDESLNGNPSCHVCGAILTRKVQVGEPEKRVWACMSCGATTEPTKPADTPAAVLQLGTVGELLERRRAYDAANPGPDPIWSEIAQHFDPETPAPADTGAAALCKNCGKPIAGMTTWFHPGTGSQFCDAMIGRELVTRTDMRMAAPLLSASQVAQRFHETYERLAPQFGYETRKESAKPWADVPENNKKLMTAVCSEPLASTGDTPQPQDALPTSEEIAAKIVLNEGLDLNPTEYSDLLDTIDSVVKVLAATLAGEVKEK